MRPASTSYDRLPVALAGVLAAFLSAGIIASQFVPATGEADSPLPDLSSAQLVEIRDARGRTVLSGEFRERVDPLGNITRDAGLVDRPGHHVIGEIEINIPGPHAMAPGQELEIDIIEMSANAKYSLFIDDREVATFTTDDRGSVDMEVHATPVDRPTTKNE
jgi:hypothetical protein